MKKILLPLLLALPVFHLQAQQGDLEAWTELMRRDVQAEKVLIITEAMQLNAIEAPIFWPLQREYQAALDKIGDERLAMIQDYLKNYESLTDKQADAIAKTSFGIEKKRLKLKEKYFAKIRKAISPSTALRFFQIESQLQSLIDSSLALELPVVPRSILIPTKSAEKDAPK